MIRLALLVALVPIAVHAAEATPSPPEASNAAGAAEGQKVDELGIPVEERSPFGLGAKIGGMLTMNRASPAQKTAAVPGAGLFGFLDTRYFLGEVSFEFARGVGTHVLNLGAGVYFPFLEGDVSPYLGGGGAMSWATFGGQGASGPRLHGAAGVLLNRLGNFTFRGEVGYFKNLFSETEREFFDDTGVHHGGVLKSSGDGWMLWLGVIL